MKFFSIKSVLVRPTDSYASATTSTSVECILSLLVIVAVGLAVAASSLPPLTDGVAASAQASSDAGVSTFFLTSPMR